MPIVVRRGKARNVFRAELILDAASGLTVIVHVNLHAGRQFRRGAGSTETAKRGSGPSISISVGQRHVPVRDGQTTAGIESAPAGAWQVDFGPGVKVVLLGLGIG